MRDKKKESVSEREKEHEEFKERLLADVFGKSPEEKVQMEQVTMLIWQFRDDPRVVQLVTEFLMKYSGTRDVVDGIEFYLPQLAHMIIHLEASWDDATLERFALVIAQHSLHVALQLNWILEGAIEDYQPETPEGLSNPAYNPLFFRRCIKLLNRLNRCVALGSPRTHELQKMYELGKITQTEYKELELADRGFTASLIMAPPTVSFGGGLGDLDEGLSDSNVCAGYLLYKRRVRKSPFRRKQWKIRYFQVTNNILYCYKIHPDQGGVLVRAMPLEGATARSVEGKYPNMFEIMNQNYVYKVRASSYNEKEKWMNFISDEAESLFENTLYQNELNEEDFEVLNPCQKARYNFFREERVFVRSLCDIAEELRFDDREKRKGKAPGLMKKLHIPDYAYLPLTNSTGPWKNVYKTLAEEVIVFNTKERCPTLMYFISKREEKNVNIDVATFMFEHLDNHQEEEKKEELEGLSENQTVEKSQEEKDTEEDKSNEVEKREAVECSTETGSALEEIVKVNFEPSLKTSEKCESESEISSVGLWHDENAPGDKESATLIDNRSQKFLQERMLQVLPKNIMKRIEDKRFKRKSKLDMATLPVQSVKIIENPNLAEDNGTTPKVDENEIDQESLDRAKEIICRGEMFTEKASRLLSKAKEDGLLEDNDIAEIQTVIAKSNDDLRQEVFVMQMIHYYKSVFVKEGLPIWLLTYRIISTSKTTGLIETINNATSIDSLKKNEKFPAKGGLKQYFIDVYGKDTESFKVAQTNFMQSLVGYSLVSFLLGLKDRHNGNIMIDIKGHLIFIDFGFAMGMAPGHEFSMEKAAFKLNEDYMDLMGGPTSECFKEFKRLFVAGFEAARANAQVALGLVEIMMYKSNFPCFTGNRYGKGISLRRFESRLMLDVPDKNVRKKAMHLIDNAMNHTGTVLYDMFQYYSNGYIP